MIVSVHLRPGDGFAIKYARLEVLKLLINLHVAKTIIAAGDFNCSADNLKSPLRKALSLKGPLSNLTLPFGCDQITNITRYKGVTTSTKIDHLLISNNLEAKYTKAIRGPSSHSILCLGIESDSKFVGPYTWRLVPWFRADPDMFQLIADMVNLHWGWLVMVPSLPIEGHRMGLREHSEEIRRQYGSST
jgi:hypothetical protein